MLLKNFLKYQSLGNDFIILDWYKKPDMYIQSMLGSQRWHDFVVSVCNRNTGVGADGVLVLKTDPSRHLHEMLIFNADGSQAQMCLNGLRCMVHYLFTQYGQSNTIALRVGQRIITNQVEGARDKLEDLTITTNVGVAHYQDTCSIKIENESLQGHCVDVGNPHFVVMQQKDRAWLLQHGQAIERHKSFAHGTNVEFVWRDDKEPDLYHLLVHERGCGMTQACSSGAAAVLRVLMQQKELVAGNVVRISMPGGAVLGWCNEQGEIFLKAQATCVFQGNF
ncbi:diaminopimelate epimerase [Candidatus Babeliales bacterium]|nr:diaminopimelate epimerase [Candidatus Babeliales bacterium]